MSNPIAHRNEQMVVIPSWLDCRGPTKRYIAKDEYTWIIPALHFWLAHKAKP